MAVARIVTVIAGGDVRRGTAVAVAIALIATGPASHARDSEGQAGQSPPLFAAFYRFCIATGAAPEAVALALKSSGATPEKPVASIRAPYPMQFQPWSLKKLGLDAMLSITVSRPPGPGGSAPVDTRSCEVQSFTKDDGSVAAARNWVGVPADQPVGGGVTYYGYRQIAGRRIPLPKDAPIGEDESWQLAVAQTGGGINLQLMSFSRTPPTGRAAAKL
jgi:hypothetical protein